MDNSYVDYRKFPIRNIIDSSLVPIKMSGTGKFHCDEMKERKFLDNYGNFLNTCCGKH